jgi:hypothetical protein
MNIRPPPNYRAGGATDYTTCRYILAARVFKSVSMQSQLVYMTTPSQALVSEKI